MEESKEITVNNPFVKWAQRKTGVSITIEARDLAEENRVIELTPEGHLKFGGKNKKGDVEYQRELQLFGAVVTEESKWKVTDACVLFSIGKLDKDADFWPKLTTDKEKLPWLKVDWDKWVDESDEEPEDQEFDFGNMQNFEDDDEESDQENEAEESDEEEN